MDKLLQSDAERAEEKESEGQQSMMMGEEGQQRLVVCMYVAEGQTAV